MTAKMKISEWLGRNVDSHAIQDHVALAASFKKATGHAACWPFYTEQQTVKHIQQRGKGGQLKTGSNKKLCYGYQVAESLAEKHGKDFNSWQTGLGFRYQTAYAAIVAAGN